LLVLRKLTPVSDKKKPGTTDDIEESMLIIHSFGMIPNSV